MNDNRGYTGINNLRLQAAKLLAANYQRLSAKHAFVSQGRTDRAWVEINLSNLCENTKTLRQLMPAQCEIMAVVKANAYGHGDIAISRALNQDGIRTFAVATIDEGIRLRKHGINGELLILGYTDPRRASELSRYRLSQTIIDARYADGFSTLKKPIHVHIKVDTGMHRLGEDYQSIDEIARIFRDKRFIVTGIYTHLCASEGNDATDTAMTKLQISRFFCLLKELKNRQLKLPKTHILSSYGVLNYSDTPGNFARLGLAIYGAVSRGNFAKAELKPVLSLKTRVALIRDVAAGESIGYGCHTAPVKETRVAVLPVGYADGLPRSLGNGAGSVLLHGFRTPIIGSICMDQLMIDVSHIPAVCHGDTATLIGCDGGQIIYAEDIAAISGTITNEILSRLGERLERVYTP